MWLSAIFFSTKPAFLWITGRQILSSWWMSTRNGMIPLRAARREKPAMSVKTTHHFSPKSRWIRPSISATSAPGRSRSSIRRASASSDLVTGDLRGSGMRRGVAKVAPSIAAGFLASTAEPS